MVAVGQSDGRVGNPGWAPRSTGNVSLMSLVTSRVSLVVTVCAASLLAGCGLWEEKPAQRSTASSPAASLRTVTSGPSSERSAPPSTSTSVIPAGGVYWNPVTNQPEVKPSQIVLTPADSGDMLTGITWTTWTQQHAQGSGIRVTKQCVPDCASGEATNQEVSLTLDGARSLPDDSGWWQFTQLTITDLSGGSETVQLAPVQ